VKTIEELADQFKGRFIFKPVTVRGKRGYRIIDTLRFKTCSMVGGKESYVIKELEHQCWCIVNNEKN
jgi:hypothetical protein